MCAKKLYISAKVTIRSRHLLGNSSSRGYASAARFVICLFVILVISQFSFEDRVWKLTEGEVARVKLV